MNTVNVATAALAALLPIVNPIGALAAFAGMTGSFDPAETRKQAIRVGLYVFAILAIFTMLGSVVLSAFGITLGALQVAGGLVVGHSGFGMIVPRENFTAAEKDHAATKADISFTPMALPLIAGPGAIGVVIALAARQPGIEDRLGIVVAVAIVSVIITVLLRWGTPIVDKLGPSGIGAITRIIGFLILAIGVELLTHGIRSLYGS
ncbi:MAG: rane protein [Nocardioidaceae bacterium]|nr:rane protein [Nocardioidaceae bacterium]